VGDVPSHKVIAVLGLDIMEMKLGRFGGGCVVIEGQPFCCCVGVMNRQFGGESIG
jgi:hypothetical protein